MTEGGACAPQVFVAGATGRLGARVVKMLLEKSPQLKVSCGPRPSVPGSPRTVLPCVLQRCRFSSQSQSAFLLRQWRPMLAASWCMQVKMLLSIRCPKSRQHVPCASCCMSHAGPCWREGCCKGV